MIAPCSLITGNLFDGIIAVFTGKKEWYWSKKLANLSPNVTRFAHVTGLFTADQQLKGDTPIYTRQNAAGTRRGLEVPEERDYYPYWGPTPWKDIAIMVSNKKTEDLMKKYVNGHHYGHKCESFISDFHHVITIVCYHWPSFKLT